MDLFWKTSAAVLITAVLSITLEKQERDIKVLLILTVCCMVGVISTTFLEPVLDFLYELQTLTNLKEDFLKILFKLVGIGLIAEIVNVVCSDAGCASLGKTLQMMASALILYLSLPIFSQLITLIRDILGEV